MSSSSRPGGGRGGAPRAHRAAGAKTLPGLPEGQGDGLGGVLPPHPGRRDPAHRLGRPDAASFGRRFPLHQPTAGRRLRGPGKAFSRARSHPSLGGERPHLNLHLDWEALTGRMGGLHETEEGVVLDADSLGTLFCDCSLSRIVFASGSEVLDVGRKTRVIPAGLRRAVIARDRHCTWPGCTRSPRWCDVHHLISWSEGGETEISNLGLLCRYHHSLTHLEIEPEEETRVMAGSGTARSP